ncbi:MAG: HIT family hydrolase [Acidimicrobiaceae bacterium]|nr:HIT family hydrolase [Acidimicrobiaceae bacterium]MBQ91513.1 HIT family hydrolase [Acidimicrobiaceae bacterium]
MSRLEQLWAGWRQAYLEGTGEDGRLTDALEVPEGGSLFSAIEQSGLPDDESFVLHRGETCFAMLNIYPYTSGHTMVLPLRPVGRLGDLSEVEHAELWSMVRDAVAAIEAAYGPGGVNVGLNQGRAAGAGIPEHLHVHCVARWSGDTNFMTAAAGIRVLPEALVESWSKLRENWPA